MNWGLRRLVRLVHTRSSELLFDPIVKYGYKGIDRIPISPELKLDNQEFVTSTDEKLDTIVSGFEGPIDATIGYGSGVFEQDGYEKKPKNLQIDLIHIVENTAQFHQSNLKKFPGHYSGLKYGGVSLVEYFQNIGTGLYFNPFVSINNSLTKYGLISRENAQKDIAEWSNLYIAGRLQKPVKFLATLLEAAQRLKVLNQYNLRSALSLSVLLNLNKTITERALYETITLLSYLGDPRMLVGGENPNKVKNIVNKQFIKFKKLYKPFIDELLELKLLISIPVNGESSHKEEMQYKVAIDQAERVRLIKNLPLNFRTEIIRLYNKESSDMASHNQIYQKIATDKNLLKKLVKAVIKIVRGPSMVQSLKGVFTSGITKSLKYMWEKRMKYNKSN